MNTELILAVLLGLILGAIIATIFLPKLLRAIFTDTARETLSQVTQDVEDKKGEYETDISKQLKEIENSLNAANASWKTSTQYIAKEVSDLTRSHTQWAEALSNPGEQGVLAEEALEVMLETAGLVKGINFDTQQTETSVDGRVRPDFYVYTPDDGVIVIDSKASMKLYREAIESDDEAHKQLKLKDHAKSVLNHVTTLGKKDYSQAIGKKTPDNVIMYVPNIAIYLSACEQIPNLVEQAWKNKVTICPPEAVYPILKNVMLTWQQKKLHENAEDIQKQAMEIHTRLKKFHSYFLKIGSDLAKAVKAFNDGANSWERRLRPAVRKIEEMGIAEKSREIKNTTSIEDAPLKIVEKDKESSR